jgi:hypothetical protein
MSTNSCLNHRRRSWRIADFSLHPGDGHPLHLTGKDGRDWYRCEHVKLCGIRMPTCPASSVGLPVRSRTGGDLVCGDYGNTPKGLSLLRSEMAG